MCNTGSAGASPNTTQIMSRSGHRAMSAISSFQIVVQNVFLNASDAVPWTENGPGGPGAVITASVEYPAGIFTQITFGGVAQGIILDKDVLFSDFVNIAIPINTIFWIRLFYQNAGGVVFYSTQNNAIYGDLLNFGTGALVDQTMGGAITNHPLLCSYGPLAIIGPTTRASVFVIGNSIAATFNVPETIARLGDTGLVMPSVCNQMASLNMSAPSAYANPSVANYLFRAAMPVTRRMVGSYYSHVICQLGINDASSFSTDQLATDLRAIYAMFPPEIKIYQTTITPYTSSTDGWVTLANQTINVGQATRTGVNELIRAGQFDRLSGYFETADVLESSRNSGKFTVHSPPPVTDDGVHPNAAGYALVTASGAINPNVLLDNPFRTFRFAVDAAYLPSDIDCIPSIKEVNITPAIISLGENLGQRASMEVTFRDHKFSFLTDSYDSGTFWGKFRARYGLKLIGYSLRLIRGSVGQPLANMETRQFKIDSSDGPTPAGEFRIIAKDILKFADGDRSLAPVPSNGFILADITNVATTFTLSPAGIGNLEYPASGFVNLGGKEICSFTRAADVMTITRAQFNTTAVAHTAQERAQLCLNYVTQDVAVIIQNLLVAFADVPSGYIQLSTWQSETAAFLATSYSALIAEPTAVSKLIDELIEQAGLVVWWNDINSQINLQVLRPVSTNAYVFNADNYIGGSLAVKEQPAKRLSQVYTYFAKLNPLVNEDQINNYRSTAFALDTSSEAAYGSVSAIKKIYSRWIPNGGRAIADTVNSHLLSRFRDPPRRVNFDVLRGSTVLPTLGVGYQIQGWPFQNTDGTPATVPVQITALNPRADVYEVEAEEISTAAFTAAASPDVHAIIIDSNQQNVDLRAMHDSIYGTPVSGQTVNCTVSAGVLVGSSSTSLPAFDIGTWPAGVTVTLTVVGRIQGAGGAGGIGRSLFLAAGTGTAGSPGGIALLVGRAISLTDTSGQIWGGGGGGGGASATGVNASGCGGGGAGNIPGVHGGGDQFTVHGSDGTTAAGGAGGAAASGQNGGAGGNPGLTGGAAVTGEAGGSTGLAISGIAFVTTVGAPGDRRGGTA
jgi:hypothetical protein